MHRVLAVAIALFAHTSAQAGDASLPLLIEQLGSPETAAQMAAARELADSGDERAIPALEGLEQPATDLLETGDLARMKGFGKGILIDFNYDTEPLPGKFPLPGIGPFSLLQETQVNHYGKVMFRWMYWNLLLPGKELPLPALMSMVGKDAEEVSA